MPGAKLEAAHGDEFEGSVKVKLGAMVLTYRGTAKIVDQDLSAHRAVIEAAAKETRGAGTAKATIVTSLQQRGDATEVEVVTELHITGKPAQFGRGVMGEVAERLIGQFADRLREEMTSDGSAAAVPSEPSSAAAPAAAPRERPSAEPIDLLAVAGAPVAKRAAGLAGGLVLLLAVVKVLRRQRCADLRSVPARGTAVLCSCGHESRLV